MSQDNNTKEKSDQEIDLVEIIKTIWANRKIIFKSVGISIVFGIIMIIGTPKSYQTETKLLIETASSSSGISSLIQQFGGLAGINMGSAKGEEALIPELYPDIVRSTPFLLEILQQKVQTSKNDSLILVSDYLSKNIKQSFFGKVSKYTIGLPFLLIDFLKSNNGEELSTAVTDTLGPLKLSKKVDDQIKSLSKMIFVNRDEETGVLTIIVEAQDAKVAAILCNKIVNLLSEYIIDYRIQKAKSDLNFVEDRYLEVEKRFKNAQINLAQYRDRNKNIIIESLQTNEENLQAEFNLAFSIFNTLSQQLEQAKMKVQEKTPVFKSIEPAKIPLRKSSPKTLTTLFFLSIFGVIIGSLIIVFRNIHIVRV